MPFLHFTNKFSHMFNAVNPGSILLIALVLLLTVFGVRKYRRNKAARLEELKKAAFNEGRLRELEKKGEKE